MSIISTLSTKEISKRQTGDQKPVYFKGLNALRFFAATAFIFHHIEQYKTWGIANNAPYKSLYYGTSVVSTFIRALGTKPVSLFFVLSGFLITYLLLAEEEKTGTISLKKFYMRRVLRIWPVYYLVIFISFFVMTFYFDLGNQGSTLIKTSFVSWLLISVFMLPNLLRFSSTELVGANQTWSVGVEEQFYLIWPFIVKKFHRDLANTLIVLIAVKLFIGWLATFLSTHIANPALQHYSNLFSLHWMMFKIEQMAIGALGAYYLFNEQKKILTIIYHPVVAAVSIVLFLSSLFFSYEFFGDTIIEAIVFIVIILNISSNPKFPLKFENHGYNFLGNISYGIYMYHTIVIALMIHALHYFRLDTNSILFNALLYTGSVLFTIIIAGLSREYFEKWFMKKKEKFMVVKSSSKSIS